MREYTISGMIMAKVEAEDDQEAIEKFVGYAISELTFSPEAFTDIKIENIREIQENRDGDTG